MSEGTEEGERDYMALLCRWPASCEVKRKGRDRLGRRHDPWRLPAV